MDVVGVVNHNHHHGTLKREKHSKKRRSGHQKALKVVYISSPMKVKTSASEFRALVQELTGQESDVARLMEINGGDHHHDHDHHEYKHVDDYNTNNHHVVRPNNKVVGPTTDDVSVLDPCRDSPTSSDSLLFEQFDDVFGPQVMDESFTGLMFPSGFLYESSQADFL